MRSGELINQWAYDGWKVEILRDDSLKLASEYLDVLNDLDHGMIIPDRFYKGYVFIPKNEPLAKKDMKYFEDNFEVFGGVTYLDYDNQYTIIGWDSCHPPFKADVVHETDRIFQQCITQNRKLIRERRVQIIKYLLYFIAILLLIYGIIDLISLLIFR